MLREAQGAVTWFLYSDEGLIQEISGANQAIRTYGWNPDGLWGTDTVWQNDGNGTFLTHNDHLYTTDILTQNDGSKAWSGVRESFGKTNVLAGNQTEYLMRFPGQWEDGVGFNQNLWREYATKYARYQTLDPNKNLIAPSHNYVFNPNVMIDHLGLFGSGMFGTPDIHQRITKQAFLNILDSCPESIVKDVSFWSSEYDRVPGSQSIENSHTHAMTPMYRYLESNGRLEGFRVVEIKGSKNKARLDWLVFIWTNLAKCEPQFLGYALHAIQDSYAHGHKNFEYWSGGIPSILHMHHDVLPDFMDEYNAVVHSEQAIKVYLKRCRACCN